jgi:TonB-linked SusC/RagA family outer membrane protein
MHLLKKISCLLITISLVQTIIVSNSVFGMTEVINELQQDTRTITGRVESSDGESLPGVTVVLPGTSQGTITDAEGNFTLIVPSNALTLHFSFIGMIAQDVNISGRNSINVVMNEDTIGLDEVVAVGYGSLQRNKVSTSIVSIAPEDIKDQLTNSLENSLEGKIAGVSIQQGSGAPGGGSTIKVRGSGSIGAGSDPLVVVDGIPMQNIFDKERSPLAMLDQSDIESIQILKDVSATAIYGSRGSNGVILISTKSGKTGKTEITFDVRGGVQQIIPKEKLDLMNAEEFATWRLENAQDYANFYGEEFNIENVALEYRNPEYWRNKGTDWQDVMTRIAPQQSYNLSVSHGTDNYVGYFSMGYTHDEGAVVETNFKRLNFRANMDYTPMKFLKVGLKLNPTIRMWGNRVGGNREDVYGNAIMSPPLDGPFLDDVPNEQPEYFDGKYDTNINSSGTFNFTNSLYDLKKQVRNDQSFDLSVQPYLQIMPLDGVTIRSQLSLQWAQSFNEYFKPSTVNTGWSLPPIEPSGSYNTGRSFNWIFENTLNYEKTIDKHSFSGLVGYTMEHYNYYGSSLNGSKFPGDEIKTLNAADQYSGSSVETNWSLLSSLFRLSYDYNVKYLMTLTLRRDGSSRFGADRRWGYFPSASVGWNISKEDFFPSSDWLTNLKLRSSYGTSGNNNIGDYTWHSLLGANNYSLGGQIASGQILTGMENRNLSWEKSTEINAGLDLILWSGRLNFIFDFYNKTTEDMLWQVPIPISSGFSSTMQNIGEIRNRGVEFSINSVNIANNDFTWSTDFNISFNRNKVLNLGPLGDIKTYVGYEGQWQITQVGHPMAMFYGWKSLGILNDWEDVENNVILPGQLPGTPHWYNADGNDIIDERDRIIIGNPHPKFRGGMNNQFIFKNFDLNISTSFAYDFDVYAGLEASVINLDGIFNVSKEVKERWRSPEIPGNGRIASSFHQSYIDREGNSDFVYNTSFLKVQNISLGYTFNNIKDVRSLRLSLSAQNPFLFTNYKYGNPDINLYGNSSTMLNYDRYDYPLTQSIEIGLSLTL